MLQDARRVVACNRGLGRFGVPENAKEVLDLLKRNMTVDRDQALVENRWLGPVEVGATVDYLDEPGSAHAQGNLTRRLLRHPLQLHGHDHSHSQAACTTAATARQSEAMPEQQ